MREGVSNTRDDGVKLSILTISRDLRKVYSRVNEGCVSAEG